MPWPMLSRVLVRIAAVTQIDLDSLKRSLSLIDALMADRGRMYLLVPLDSALVLEEKTLELPRDGTAGILKIGEYTWAVLCTEQSAITPVLSRKDFSH